MVRSFPRTLGRVLESSGRAGVREFRRVTLRLVRGVGERQNGLSEDGQEAERAGESLSQGLAPP